MHVHELHIVSLAHFFRRCLFFFIYDVLQQLGLALLPSSGVSPSRPALSFFSSAVSQVHLLELCRVVSFNSVASKPR